VPVGECHLVELAEGKKVDDFALDGELGVVVRVENASDHG
jgi:hypothetical protein